MKALSPKLVVLLLPVALIAAIQADTYAVGNADSKQSRRATQTPIKILNPHQLSAADIPATRTALGQPNDYKPWLAKLKNGQLLMVAFSYGGTPSNLQAKGTPYLERAVFWRSDDGGKTWGPREERMDIHGREFSLNVLADGTLIMPCHFLGNDAANKTGHTHSKVFRSTDNGQTWEETRIGPKGFPARAGTASDWTTFELPDPNRPGKLVTFFGVSMQHGGKNAPNVVRLWKSTDNGKTWDKSFQPDTNGWIDVDGFFSQSTTYRTASGKLLHPVRVDRTGPHWKLPTTSASKIGSGDQGDRSMLWQSTDDGRSWKKHNTHGTFGTYGEMYSRFLGLKDGRLLLTFTVRSHSTDGYPLGLRAIICNDDGETWDFTRDRIVIDAQNQGPSGGGFGNTLQLDDSSLISCYSYRAGDGKTYIEAVRWSLPKLQLPN